MKKLVSDLLNQGIIEYGKITELFNEGVSIWKGMSDDLVNSKYEFLNFINKKDNSFNEAFYKIEVKRNSLNESRLPSDKNQDPEFGLPEDKKFPLFDKSHVESAVRFFNYVKGEEKEKRLAHAIIRKMKEYNISFDMVGDDNKLKKYIHNDALDENFKQAYRDGGKKLDNYINGKAKSRLIAYGKDNSKEGEDPNKVMKDALADSEKDYEKRASSKNEKENKIE